MVFTPLYGDDWHYNLIRGTKTPLINIDGVLSFSQIYRIFIGKPNEPTTFPQDLIMKPRRLLILKALLSILKKPYL